MAARSITYSKRSVRLTTASDSTAPFTKYCSAVGCAVVGSALSVALVVREMRRAGFSSKDIKQVTLLNGYEFFRQSPKFTWRP